MDSWDYHVIADNRRPASEYFTSDDSQFSDTSSDDNNILSEQQQPLLQDPQRNYCSTGITTTANNNNKNNNNNNNNDKSAPAMVEERETTDSGAAKPKSRRPASMGSLLSLPLSFSVSTFLFDSLALFSSVPPSPTHLAFFLLSLSLSLTHTHTHTYICPFLTPVWLLEILTDDCLVFSTDTAFRQQRLKAWQ